MTGSSIVLEELLARNRRWAARMRGEDADFFARLALGQRPRIFWIGCSDSRVPATQIVDLTPGEIFVHRNVANVVSHSDMNCLAALQFAVDVLEVEDVIVCGHYGCGGVQAVVDGSRYGLVDNWIHHVAEVRREHDALYQSAVPSQRARRLCELNAVAQAANVAETTIVREAWERSRTLAVHAWIYGVADGLIRDLGFHARNRAEVPETLNLTLTALAGS